MKQKMRTQDSKQLKPQTVTMTDIDEEESTRLMKLSDDQFIKYLKDMGHLPFRNIRRLIKQNNDKYTLLVTEINPFV